MMRVVACVLCSIRECEHFFTNDRLLFCPSKMTINLCSVAERMLPVHLSGKCCQVFCSSDSNNSAKWMSSVISKVFEKWNCVSNSARKARCMQQLELETHSSKIRLEWQLSPRSDKAFKATKRQWRCVCSFAGIFWGWQGTITSLVGWELTGVERSLSMATMQLILPQIDKLASVRWQQRLTIGSRIFATKNCDSNDHTKLRSDKVRSFFFSNFHTKFGEVSVHPWVACYSESRCFHARLSAVRNLENNTCPSWKIVRWQPFTCPRKKKFWTKKTDIELFHQEICSGAKQWFSCSCRFTSSCSVFLLRCFRFCVERLLWRTNSHSFFQVIWGALHDFGAFGKCEPNQCEPNQISYRQGLPKYVYTCFIVKMRIDLGSFGLFWFILGWG